VTTKKQTQPAEAKSSPAPVDTVRSLTYRRDHQTGLYYITENGVDLDVGGFTTLADVNNKIGQLNKETK